MVAQIYDVETFPNGFWVSFIPVNADKELFQQYVDADIDHNIERKIELIPLLGIKVFGIFGSRNDLKELVQFVQSCPILIGFNNKLYDNLLIDFLCINYPKFSRYDTNRINTELFDLSKQIIDAQGANIRYLNPVFRKYSHPYLSIDLLSVLFEVHERKSLKQTAINLKWHRIQDLPYEPTHFVLQQEENKVIDYNINDILITLKLYWHGLDIINLRVVLSPYYGVNLLNANKSKMADLLLSKFYSDSTGLRYYDYKDLRTPRKTIDFGEVIDKRIHFTDPKLTSFLNNLKSTVFDVASGDFIQTLIFRDTAYTFATGGLHAKDRPMVLKSTDKVILRDADVKSYYPNLVVKLRVCPAHLSTDAFISITAEIIAERIAAKGVDPIKADGLKIVLNSGMFGKFGFPDGWLYDPKALYTVTLNGQLFLLMLIEKFEDNGIHVVSANTDGIVVKLPLDKEELYYGLCNDWCKLTQLELDYTDYAKYVRTTVNDYLAQKTNGKIKKKGDFITDVQLVKGYSMPIVAIAIENYFLNGIPVETTLRNHDNIYDFCISQRIGEQFVAEYHELKNSNLCVTPLQKNIRYFVTTRGGTLMKRYKDSSKRLSAVAGEMVTIFNDYFRVNSMADYNIKYNFYRKECDKIINNISNIITAKTKKQAGRLFD